MALVGGGGSWSAKLIDTIDWYTAPNANVREYLSSHQVKEINVLTWSSINNQVSDSLSSMYGYGYYYLSTSITVY